MFWLFCLAEALLCLAGKSTDLIEKVYPEIGVRYADKQWLKQRAILAPRNDAVDRINRLCLDQVPGDSRT